MRRYSWSAADPEPPLDREDRRAYQLELKHFLAGAYPEKPGRKAAKVWEKLQSNAKAGVDDHGSPVLQMQVGNSVVEIGVSANNVMNGNAPPELERQLLAARLQSELRSKSTPGLTENEIARDWKLLQKTLGESDSLFSPRPPRAENVPGNQP